MDILISFTTSVGVVEACQATKGLAIDIINESIVLAVKNIKVPNVGAPDNWLNNRDINRTIPPEDFGGSGFNRLLQVSEWLDTESVSNWAPGVPWRIITQSQFVPPSNQGINKLKFSYYFSDGTLDRTEEREDIIYSIGGKVCDDYGSTSQGSVWASCSYHIEGTDGSYSSLYRAVVSYLYYPV